MEQLDPTIQQLFEDDVEILEVLSDSDSDREADAQWQQMAEAAVATLRDDPVQRKKVHQYAEETVIEYMDDDFRGHFRMTRECVDGLVHELAAHGTWPEENGGGHAPMTVRKSLLVYLWTMGNQDTIRSIADRFGITKSSTIRSNRKVKAVLCGPLMALYVKWPTAGARGKALGPNGSFKLVGAVDGSHIPISEPTEHQENYVNRKGFHSINLQAVCQHDLKFIDIYAGWPGSVHDARVFKNSPLFDNLATLCGEGHLIAGDTAYPLMNHLMTPFKDNGHLTPEQKRFNFKLSSERCMIERAFALLKGRFRRLKFLKMWSIKETTESIIAACVLHNICLGSDAEWEDMFVDGDGGDGGVDPEGAVQITADQTTADRAAAAETRLRLMLAMAEM